MQSKGEVRWIHTWHINVVRLQNLQSPSLISSHAMIRPSYISRFSFFFFLFFFLPHAWHGSWWASQYTRDLDKLDAIGTEDAKDHRHRVFFFFFFVRACAGRKCSPAHAPDDAAIGATVQCTHRRETCETGHQSWFTDRTQAPRQRSCDVCSLTCKSTLIIPPRTPILINFAHTRRRVNQYFLFYFWYWWYPMS